MGAEAHSDGKLAPGHARERELAALAAEQHGVVARRQLTALGFSRRSIEIRLRAGRLHRVHRAVYAVAHQTLTQQGLWLAAVLAYGEEAVLSHRSAAALWGFLREFGSGTEVTSPHGHPGRPGIKLHKGRADPGEYTKRNGIPVTSVARTLIDLAGVIDAQRLERVFEEADRLGLLKLRELEHLCEHLQGRRGMATIRGLIATAREPAMVRSPLEERFVELCRKHGLPPPLLNVSVLGFQVDTLWPRQHLIVELDGFAFHRQRAAFERDRARDAALQVAGYRIVRLTHRRLEETEEAVVEQLRRLLEGADSAKLNSPSRRAEGS